MLIRRWLEERDAAGLCSAVGDDGETAMGGSV